MPCIRKEDVGMTEIKIKGVRYVKSKISNVESKAGKGKCSHTSTCVANEKSLTSLMTVNFVQLPRLVSVTRL
jgi:hypothetical protein